MKERIQKILSEQGICSRRAADKLIAENKVKVNGHPAKLGDKIDVNDVVMLDGKRVYFVKKTEKVCYAVNKPRGYITALSDDHDHKCISELLSDLEMRLFPIGRLDLDSEGLVLMTNDGELANAVMHPSHKVGKLYRVSVAPGVKEEQLIELTSGVKLDDGYVTMPAIIRTIENSPERAVLEFTISEGKNRQVRRMCEAVGLEVKRLKRLSIGPVRLGPVAVGKYRELSRQEVKALWNSVVPKDVQH